VPTHSPISEECLLRFSEQLASIDRLVVFTGAGVSTESGIPDYRSDKVGLYARTEQRPISIQQFLSSAENRTRFWARNFAAWPKFSNVQCNLTHHRLAEWERRDRLTWLITQNVDNLHRMAGSERLTELHGSGHRVVCLGCDGRFPREDIQRLLEMLNPLWLVEEIGQLAPDGDVQISAEALKSFRSPMCPNCGGVLRTDVVFFGDNVRSQIVNECFEKIEQSDGMLVLGSSLAVYSGFRFVDRARRGKKPVLVVNIGECRADTLATLKIAGLCSTVLREMRR